jgi:hypothetical protein
MLFPLCSLAADWKEYFINKVGTRFSIDSSSKAITREGNVRAWEQQQWAKEDPKLGRGFIYLIEVDCRQRTYTYKDIMPINGNTEALKMASTMMEMYGGVNYFQPSDLDEARYRAFCGKLRQSSG